MNRIILALAVAALSAGAGVAQVAPARRVARRSGRRRRPGVQAQTPRPSRRLLHVGGRARQPRRQDAAAERPKRRTEAGQGRRRQAADRQVLAARRSDLHARAKVQDRHRRRRAHRRDAAGRARRPAAIRRQHPRLPADLRRRRRRRARAPRKPTPARSPPPIARRARAACGDRSPPISTRELSSARARPRTARSRTACARWSDATRTPPRR